MIYLASPYTDTDLAVMQSRYEHARTATGYLLAQRAWVYSPIVHCHEVARTMDLPRDFDYWAEYNFHMLLRADAIIILTLAGWSVSRGVAGEIAFWRTVKRTPIREAGVAECVLPLNQMRTL